MSRIRPRGRARGMVMGFVLGVLLGALATTQEAAASCSGEVVDLLDPVVLVIEGPGDPGPEMALWSSFDYLQLIGSDELHLDGTVATIEASP